MARRERSASIYRLYRTCAWADRGLASARLRALRLRREAAEGAGRRRGRHRSRRARRLGAAVGREAGRNRLVAEGAPGEGPLNLAAHHTYEREHTREMYEMTY